MSKLAELLKKTAEKNEFYQKRIAEYHIQDVTDITQYPVLTRQELQENRYHMFSEGYKSKYFSQQLRRQSSSGSSGVPVNVYWDDNEWYASNMVLWRKRLQWYGIRPIDKYAIFTLSLFDVKQDNKRIQYINESANVLSVNVSLIKNEEGYEKLAVLINDFNPVWLYIQPFVLERLIRGYQRSGLQKPSGLQYIESVGELLSSNLRRRAEEFFGVPLANMYGSEEMNGIAYECPFRHMHILKDNVLVEIKNKKGVFQSGEGEAVITNLHNNGMPLIRYNQGDLITLTPLEVPCQCGTGGLEVKLIKGRVTESVTVSDEYELNSSSLIEIMSEINNQYNGIVCAFNFVYSISGKELICRIAMDRERSGWYNSVSNTIKELFHTLALYGISIKVEAIEENILSNRKPNIFQILE